MRQRRDLLGSWLARELGSRDLRIEPASSDASFRRYWRVGLDGETYVAMDAPPEQEDTARFVALAETFRAAGLNTPRIHAREPALGFLLMQDLGTCPYLDALQPANVDLLYGDALDALALIQARVPTEGLPAYDGHFLRREMDLFLEWLIGRHLGLSLSPGEREAVATAFDLLAASALEQPRVCVHRDFHSRNLMVTPPPSPGILDFQDAVAGPVTYDLASLLRDCYIAWPRERVEAWALGYLSLAVESGILPGQEEKRFLTWFDLMGIQRHLKASGIFARLSIRDGKDGYLGDIPRTLGYLVDVAAGYPALEGILELVADRVLPALDVPHATSEAERSDHEPPTGSGLT